MQAISLLVTPLILFLVLVAPIWLILHYRSKNKMHQGLSIQDKEALNQLLLQAKKMSDRIETIEQLLEQDNSNHGGKDDLSK